jgi:hypothetical protein
VEVIISEEKRIEGVRLSGSAVLVIKGSLRI